MQRPPEYSNLITRGYFEEVEPTTGALEVYLGNAANYLKSASQIAQDLHMQRFTSAYEGYFQVVQAILEAYTVRARDVGRNFVIQRVSTDLGMQAPEMKIVIKAHERRNSTTYHSPFPPVSKAEADALVLILEKYLQRAYELTGVARPAKS